MSSKMKKEISDMLCVILF